MVLTKDEFDSLLHELDPKIDTEEHRMELGLGAYTELFAAHPEYIKKFSRLQEATPANVMAQDGAKYYAKTLINDLVELLKASTDEATLNTAIARTATKDHKPRNVSGAEFQTGEPIFIKYFSHVLTTPANQAFMEKLLTKIFTGVAGQL
uniref:Globin n=1 Tax=Isoparorchis hypselobagri TaxID=36663 RepID=GLB_ISOHY|nr:RecName: Full=Globin; AltName: Full=Myoglobin [Isoparorchis hypselobagri]